MKKTMAIIMMMVMIMTAAVAAANTSRIWDCVNKSWIEENQSLYNMFINTEYDINGFEKDGITYYAGTDIYLTDDCTVYQTQDIERYCTEVLETKVGKGNVVNVSVKEIGYDEYYKNRVLQLYFEVKNDLRYVEGSGVDVVLFTNPVHGFMLICYDQHK